MTRWSRNSWSLMVVALAVGLSACGTLARTDGGAENLPSRRIIPWEKPTDPDDETSTLPFVWIDEERSLDEPCPLIVDGRVVLYAESSLNDQSVIVRAVSEDGLSFGPAETVLEPTLAWEESWVGAPTLLEREDTLFLFYVGGLSEPAIGLARSTDGESWTREAEPVLLPRGDETLGSPSVVWLDGAFTLYYASETWDPDSDSIRVVIDRAASLDGLSLERIGTVLEPGVGCEDYDGEPIRCWDDERVGYPGTRVTTSPTGRTLVDIWYTGGIGERTGIGFAGSNDGTSFSRYELNPIIADSGSERAAAVIQLGHELLMYFSERREDARALAVAIQ